ncbi:hypothetical protein M407DRAFT_241365 [Tulasnella calospora MUT 4182]|uniref:Uncharacterized protein n=1 Tax=Tulasnella calospora MUT 4182 TaxID=1051891 RepID=A0A0C3LES4_9AGAM|nr:hypothetical protein M407DRAFT_241365 [Tulasnella calospora MUT 4182]
MTHTRLSCAMRVYTYHQLFSGRSLDRLDVRIRTKISTGSQWMGADALLAFRLLASSSVVRGRDRMRR